MTPFLQLSLAIAIMIAAAKAGGYLSLRLGQPSVLGELLMGLVLGPSLIDLLHLGYFSDTHLAETVHHMAEIGVLLLMFIAGLELHLSDLAKSGKVAVLAGVFGVAIPLLLGVLVGMAFNMTLPVSIFIGLILSATSVSISAQTLMEMKVLRSRVGIGLLGAAVFDDVLVVLGLSVFAAITLSETGGDWISVLWIVGRMLLFLGGALALGMILLPRISVRISRLPISQGLIAFALVILLLYGWSAEELGKMAAITGAFLAGLMFAQSPSIKERIESGIAPLAYGMFVPIFFIDVGLRANVRDLGAGVLGLFGVLVLVAIIGKVAGAGLGALWSGFSRRESLQLGIGMMSRGEVGLIVASVGISEGLIPQAVFSAIVVVVIITTLLTPPLLRISFREPGSKNKTLEEPIADLGV